VLWVRQARQSIGDSIEIGRDVEPVNLGIVGVLPMIKTLCGSITRVSPSRNRAAPASGERDHGAPVHWASAH
jgi:hypothetical protein